MKHIAIDNVGTWKLKCNPPVPGSSELTRWMKNDVYKMESRAESLNVHSCWSQIKHFLQYLVIVTELIFFYLSEPIFFCMKKKTATNALIEQIVIGKSMIEKVCSPYEYWSFFIFGVPWCLRDCAWSP